MQEQQKYFAEDKKKLEKIIDNLQFSVRVLENRVSGYKENQTYYQS